MPLGQGTNNAVRGLAVRNDQLFAVGDFLLAGGDPSFHIAGWSALDWEMPVEDHDPDTDVAHDPPVDNGDPPQVIEDAANLQPADPPGTQTTTVPLLTVPNPFRAGDAIVVSPSKAVDAEISIFDVHGRNVGRLLAGELGAGSREIHWDARGANAPSGVYYLRARIGDARVNRIIVLAR
jgi:hypothetical protein